MGAALEPTWAERARTALAQAHVATLETGGNDLAPTLTMVEVEATRPGLFLMWIQENSPAIDALSTRRVARLTLPGPTSVWSLRLDGTFRIQRREPSGMQAYTPTLHSVQAIGPQQVTIPVADLLGSEPDPLRDHSTAVLGHLQAAHREALLACARAHGHDAEAVVVRSLDRYGLELSLLGTHGVDRLRLEFPHGPIRQLDDLSVGLRLPLICTCKPRQT